MKHKPPLILMEEMVMLLVFALAAALCLQAFVKSEGLSRDSEVRDQAVVLCQNVAETLRGSGGSIGAAVGSAAEKLGYHGEHAILWQEFDEDWNPVEDGVYRLETEGIPADVPGLVAAHICVRKGYHADREAEVVFELEVAWQQEVSGSGH